MRPADRRKACLRWPFKPAKVDESIASTVMNAEQVRSERARAFDGPDHVVGQQRP
jgi:hypothetical protein